jgi:hypothetical protein
MPRNRLILLLAWAPLTGCTLIDRAVYNIEYDKALRADLEDRAAYHRLLAGEAWGEAWLAGGEPTSDGPFGEGFVDGFADYLDHNGWGAPPAAPPNRYRFGSALSPEGNAAALRYFAGFAEGARAARASGLRRFSLVPVLAPLAESPDRPPAALGPGPAELPRPTALPPAGQLGPPPREVPEPETRRPFELPAPPVGRRPAPR